MQPLRSLQPLESFQAAWGAKGAGPRAENATPAQPTTIGVMLGSPPKMAAQNDSNGCRLRRGRIFCSWPCAPRPWLPEMIPMAVGCDEPTQGPFAL